MPYELECGHCGFQFVLDAWPLPRSVQCSVCGGKLTLAVPLSPPTAPEPPPLPPRDIGDKRDEDDAGAEPEELGPRRLADPWPVIHIALNVARTAAEVGGVLYAVAVAFHLFVSPFTSVANEARATDRMLTVTVISLIIPTLMHVVVMGVAATRFPPAYGGHRALASVGLMVLTLLAAGAVHGVTNARRLPDTTVIGLTTTTALLGGAAAFAVWLTVLVRLGGCLGSGPLTNRARAVWTWFPFWVVLVASFLMCSVVGESAKAPPVAWAGRVLLAGTVLAALWHYSGLLAFAVGTVESRAPAAR